MTEFDEATLTISARGPAVVETQTEHDGVAVTETRETELEASFTVDAAALAEVADVYRAGVVLTASDAAQHVLDSLEPGAGETYRVPDTDAWTVTVSGRVDDHLEVALAAADAKQSMRSHVLSTAAEILDTLATDYSDTDRPLLALYDLLTTTEADAYAPADIVERLGGESTVDAEADAEATEGSA